MRISTMELEVLNRASYCLMVIESHGGHHLLIQTLATKMMGMTVGIRLPVQSDTSSLVVSSVQSPRQFNLSVPIG